MPLHQVVVQLQFGMMAQQFILIIIQQILVVQQYNIHGIGEMVPVIMLFQVIAPQVVQLAQDLLTHLQQAQNKNELAQYN